MLNKGSMSHGGTHDNNDYENSAMAKGISIDLNCDLGESYGAYKMGNDEQMMPLISSANIACGFHAGDASIMRQTVRLCLQHDVAIGAHPGLPDIAGFGRRQMAISAEDAYDIVLYQLGALSAIAAAEGGQLHHVKLHGALYHMAIDDKSLAEAIVRAIDAINPELIVYGFPSSALLASCERIGLRCMREAFIDRAYDTDGSLLSRTHAQATITDIEDAGRQAVNIAKLQNVIAYTGERITMQAETLCIHGDHPQAVLLAEHVRDIFNKEGIIVRSCL